MSEQNTRLGVGILLVSLGLGVAGHALLKVGPVGVNLPVWIALITLGAVLLGRGTTAGANPRTRLYWLLVPGVAALSVWRDSPALRLLDLGLLAIAFAAWRWEAAGVPVWAGGVLAHGWRFCRAALDAAAGYLPLFLGRVAWPAAVPDGMGTTVRATTTGVCLALPPLLLFGALFMSADVVFARFIKDLLRIDLQQLMADLIPITLLAWICAGFLQGLLIRRTTEPAELPAPTTNRFGPLELGVALGLVNALFALFIVFQVRYLFGGSQLVEVTPGLTYAEYARRGFFELVAVAALALPMLLVGDWLLGENSRSGFRRLAWLSVLLLACVLASALHRMRLYQHEYGWTEQRFYVTAFMGWLALVLVWFGLSVLRGHRERFVAGAVAGGVALLVVLHALNPDAFIVRHNLAQTRSARGFDAAYAARLSLDALPPLVEVWPQLDSHAQGVIEERLVRRLQRQGDDWRLWSWSRHQARAAAQSVWLAP
jgi:hypothetical protein